jgi:TonB family protein
MSSPLKYLYRLGFGCLLLSAAVGSAQETAVKRSLPALSVDLNSLAYPGSAQRAGLQGRVLTAFNISRKGRAQDIEIVSAEPPEEFDATAIRAVKQVRFTVPRDWEDSGGETYRFQLSVLFRLNPCVAPACVTPTPHESADDFLVIGAQVK